MSTKTAKTESGKLVKASANHRQHINRLTKTAVFAKRDAWYNVPFGKQCKHHFDYGDDAEQFQAVEHKFLLIFV